MNYQPFADTIFALATPPGRSGVAVIRISGPRAADTFAALGMSCPIARVAIFATLKNVQGEAIDQSLLLWFPSPASFTGEDVAELQTHGSRAVIAQIIALLSTLPGFRPAEAGEFTRRALTNGKMDLAQAEGLADLIDAETLQQSRQALHFMQGHASARYRALRERALHALAQLEAYVDFPDEDIPPDTQARIDVEMDGLRNDITALLAQSRQGEAIRDGFHIALVGGPNVGKSSLLNALAGRDVAIVSHRAGTTRDVIEVHLDIGGFSVILADTAGIREHADEIEQEGIRRTLERAEAADLRLMLFDATESQTPEAIRHLVTEKDMVVLTKCDAGPLPIPAGLAGFAAHCLSAKTGFGLTVLLDSLSKKLASFMPMNEPSVISRTRHRQACLNALQHIDKYKESSDIELRCEDLRQVFREIGKVTGTVDIEEVLDEIFRRFCIGK